MSIHRSRGSHVPHRPLLLLLLLLPLGACGGSAPRIIDRPVPFSEQRQELTRGYMEDRYGLAGLEIEPKMIVLHWTAIADYAGSYRAFERETLANSRPELRTVNDVNVSIQFLVDKDGTIYRLMPETWMARHVIGLNHVAIGVENVGGARGEDDLTDAQIEANAALVRYLKKKYPQIEYVIGHHEYREFEGHVLWRERDPNYRTVKTDPGDRFMSAVRERIRDLGLQGPPRR